MDVYACCELWTSATEKELLLLYFTHFAITVFNIESIIQFISFAKYHIQTACYQVLLTTALFAYDV